MPIPTSWQPNTLRRQIDEIITRINSFVNELDNTSPYKRSHKRRRLEQSSSSSSTTTQPESTTVLSDPITNKEVADVLRTVMESLKRLDENVTETLEAIAVEARRIDDPNCTTLLRTSPLEFACATDLISMHDTGNEKDDEGEKDVAHDEEDNEETKKTPPRRAAAKRRRTSSSTSKKRASNKSNAS